MAPPFPRVHGPSKGAILQRYHRLVADGDEQTGWGRDRTDGADPRPEVAAHPDGVPGGLGAMRGEHPEVAGHAADEVTDQGHEQPTEPVASSASDVPVVDPDELAHLRATLDAVGRALDRLTDGSYGACSSCGQPIDQSVLDEDPTAEDCGRHGSPVDVTA